MHLGHELVIDGDATFGVELVDVLLEGREAQLITVLKVTVILGMLLHRIVGQVHKSIVDVLQVDAELRAGGAKVALPEKEELVVLIEQHPHPNVKLALVDEQRSLDVLLNDERVMLDLVARGLLAARRGCLVRGLVGATSFLLVRL